MSSTELLKYTKEQTQQALLGLKDWSLLEGKEELHRSFVFDEYFSGVDFALMVASLAEEKNHHPNILISWCRVEISLSTHDVGGLSHKDFELAALIDKIADQEVELPMMSEEN
jgi:4a-hydroxytetrahydrobiopterin dehydratase